jgi:hypothetical protein
VRLILRHAANFPQSRVIGKFTLYRVVVSQNPVFGNLKVRLPRLCVYLTSVMTKD